jgi:predicted alpha/beta superfamily hydrolase
VVGITRWPVLLAVLMSFCVVCQAEDTQSKDEDTVTLGFHVTVPAGTPEGDSVCLSGGDARMGGWDGVGLVLERQEDGTYRGSLAFKRGAHVQFKATRGSWGTVEKSESGGEIENRYVIADKDKQVEVVVAVWAEGERGAKQIESTLTGDIRRHEGFRSEILGNERTVLVYLPPGYESDDERRYPVLYMHDGQNIFDASTSFAGNEWGVDEAAERLIKGGEIEPIVIVGIYNNGDRMTEYTPRPEGDKTDAYARFVVEEVKVFIDGAYRTDPGREKTGVGGSSLGGLMSLYMVEAYADTFGRCAGVSPSLWWDDRWLIKRWGEGDMSWTSDARIWIGMGTAEGRAEGDGEVASGVLNARELLGLLKGSGGDGEGYAYVEVQGGRHNEQAWAQRIEAVLIFLYGTP